MDIDTNIKRLYMCDQPHKHWYEYIYSRYYPDSPHNSKHLFDIYTLTHVFWSALLVLIIRAIIGDNKWGPIGVFIFVTLFEPFENMARSVKKYRRIEINSNGSTYYRGDSLINSLGDIIGNIVGIYLAITLSNQANYIILMILFILITYIVNITYWTDFFDFTIQSLY